MEEIVIDATPSQMILYKEQATTEPGFVRAWDQDRPVGYELTDTKRYKTPSGVQKTATIQREQLSSVGKEQIVETDGEFSMDPTEFLAIPSTSAATDPTPSTSTTNLSHQPVPLRRMAIKIGERVLRFKVISAADAPEPPTENPEHQLLEEPMPLTSPKALAGLFHCAQCKTYFGNKEVYQRHITEVHGDARPFRCFNCGMRFANKTSMTHHLKDHSLLKPMFSCEYCPRIFSKLENRNRHHKMHFNRMTCPTCMRFFTTQEALQNHQNTAHANAPNPNNFDDGAPPGDILSNGKTARFNCGYCNLRFHFKKDMLVHERIHTGEKPYSCGYCGKSFAQSQALTAHIRMHTKELPYGCAKCSKQFRDNSSLRKHELGAHSSEPMIRPVMPHTIGHLNMQRVQRRKQQLMVSNRQPEYRIAP